MDKVSFVWGMVVALLAVILVFIVSLIVFTGIVKFELTDVLIYTIFAIIIAAIGIEIGIFVYYMFSIRPGVGSVDRLKEMEIRLLAVESAKKEIQDRYYKREISEDSYKKMLDKFEEEGTGLRSEIKAMKKRI